MPFLVLAKKASREGCREEKQVANPDWKPQKSSSKCELGGESTAERRAGTWLGRVLATREDFILQFTFTLEDTTIHRFLSEKQLFANKSSTVCSRWLVLISSFRCS